MNWLENIELEELETMFTEENEDQLKERFKIKDLSSLNWALRKLSALEKSHAEESELATIEIARIRAWFDKQDQSFQQSKNFLEGLIGEYAKEQRVIDPKWKSKKTPYGVVGFRKQQPKWNYGDEDKLVDFMEENGLDDLVKIEKKHIKADLKKLLIVKDGIAVNPRTGEVIPQITVDEQEPLLSIKLEV